MGWRGGGQPAGVPANGDIANTLANIGAPLTLGGSSRLNTIAGKKIVIVKARRLG